MSAHDWLYEWQQEQAKNEHHGDSSVEMPSGTEKAAAHTGVKPQCAHILQLHTNTNILTAKQSGDSQRRASAASESKSNEEELPEHHKLHGKRSNILHHHGITHKSDDREAGKRVSSPAKTEYHHLHIHPIDDEEEVEMRTERTETVTETRWVFYNRNKVVIEMEE